MVKDLGAWNDAVIVSVAVDEADIFVVIVVAVAESYRVV